ncbi:Heterokaryon incompatibility protein 6, OR allele [Madurella mycetomatis]|uniref:Heterokaryon incompatibility protein 6, OR allele n=1 Tax=Madurella mycetomatis TaxID=100816 RepID=A0A175WCP5_9PEZI|nr:Heterokaryon incompatibility protein 6, OR allele [Madurella mycetomatis]
MSCPTCYRVDESLALFETALAFGTGGASSYGGPRDFLLGSRLDLEWRATHCESCRSILASIGTAADDARASGAVTAHLSPSPLRFFLLAGDIEGVQSTDFDARRSSLQKLIYVPCHSTRRAILGEERGRECDPNAVDVELVKTWIRRCDTAHAHSCVRRHDLYLLPTARLSFIDVERLCIVTHEADNAEVRYAALSYVWGTLPVLRALKSNMADLRRPGAFCTAKYQLPRTISDAVTLCSRLGIRYLWVDSLCIVQDDPESQGEQLRAMGAVYGEAYLTIVALRSEHAHSGIHRVGPTDAACKPQAIIRLPSQPLIVVNNRAALGLNILNIGGIKWNTRGWTLQEVVFSRRILAMGELASWACFGCQWTEDVEYASELDGGPAPEGTANDGKLGPVTWPSISAYAGLALEYAARDLTYSSDTVNAFAGILTPMNGWFPGGLLYGISEFTFDVGLLWNITPSFGGARLRSDPGAVPPLAGGSPIKFPTWSWISWTGRLQFNLWGEAEDYSFPRGPFLLRPLVAWQKRLVSTGAWSKVDNSYHVVRAHFRAYPTSFPSSQDATPTGPTTPPPPTPQGWVKHVDPDSGEVYYQHPDHSHALPRPPRFAYPIPPFVRPRDMDRDEYHPYLRFRGGHARLVLGINEAQRAKLATEVRQRGRATELDLLIPDASRSWAGRVTLNLQRGEQVPGGEVIEVIAISEGVLDLDRVPHARFVFPEVTQRGEFALARMYEVMNVLWIGWVGEGAQRMAYRKGLGRVWKRAWERMEVDEVELLLT